MTEQPNGSSLERTPATESGCWRLTALVEPIALAVSTLPQLALWCIRVTQGVRYGMRWRARRRRRHQTKSRCEQSSIRRHNSSYWACRAILLAPRTGVGVGVSMGGGYFPVSTPRFRGMSLTEPLSPPNAVLSQGPVCYGMISLFYRFPSRVRSSRIGRALSSMSGAFRFTGHPRASVEDLEDSLERASTTIPCSMIHGTMPFSRSSMASGVCARVREDGGEMGLVARPCGHGAATNHSHNDELDAPRLVSSTRRIGWRAADRVPLCQRHLRAASPARSDPSGCPGGGSVTDRRGSWSGVVIEDLRVVATGIRLRSLVGKERRAVRELAFVGHELEVGNVAIGAPQQVGRARFEHGPGKRHDGIEGCDLLSR